MRIAVDMDEVIADAHSAQIVWLRANHDSEKLKCLDDVASLRDLLDPEIYQSLQDHMHEGKFFEGILPIDKAPETLLDLSQSHEVFIVTAACEYPASIPYKFAWLRKNFGFLDPLRFVFCGDKSVVAADILIDDSPRHFRRFKGQGILFDAPHNRAEVGYPRARTWPEAHELVNRWSDENLTGWPADVKR